MYLSGLRSDITTSQDLSANPLSYTTTINRRFRLKEIAFKFSVAVNETITITRDSKHGANYDVKLLVAIISDATSYRFVPKEDIDFQIGDEIKIECSNDNLLGTVYSTIKTWEILG